MLESITAMVERGWKVVVVTPDDGPLVALIEERGPRSSASDCAVVRQSTRRRRDCGDSCGSRSAPCAILPGSCGPCGRRCVHEHDHHPVVVRRRPSLSHPRRATCTRPRPRTRPGPTGALRPLLLAHRLIVISRPSMETVCATVPRLRRRATMIFNGVRNRPSAPSGRGRSRPATPVVLGRLSPRRGPTSRSEAVALRQSVVTSPSTCGSTFPGYSGSMSSCAVVPRSPTWTVRSTSPASSLRSGRRSSVPRCRSLRRCGSRSATPWSRRS